MDLGKCGLLVFEVLHTILEDLLVGSKQADLMHWPGKIFLRSGGVIYSIQACLSESLLNYIPVDAVPQLLDRRQGWLDAAVAVRE